MPFFKKSKNKKENSAAAPPPAPADTSSEITPDKETDSRESGVTAFSAQTLLQELQNRQAEHPQDLEFIQSRLPEIMEICGQHAENPEPADAAVRILLSPDRMTAFLYLLPPADGGAEPEENDIISAAQDAGITTGIDMDLLKQIYQHRSYYCVFPIARGTPPVDGENGKIVDHFSIIRQIHLQEDSRGSINYKDLNLFQNIEAGEVICDIIPPGDGTDGIDVLGHAVPAKKGNAPVIPQGKNTVLNEEKTALTAKVSGEISFQNDVFRVASRLTIPGSVDGSVGNLDFAGDILVMDDICRGFTVHAGGNVIVYGMVENASVTAGEDIEIRKGMNGSGGGFLKAGGNVSSLFLEHVRVTANGNVSSETIINSNITCGGSVLALSGRGTIIGGNISASKSVEARKIGTPSNNETRITIGQAVQEEKNTEHLSAELEEAVKTLEKIRLNYRYLTEQPSVPENKKEIFNILSEQKALYEKKVKDLNEQIDKMLRAKPNYSKCRVKSDIIYGVTEISLNHSHLIIKDTKEHCNIYYKDAELVLGTF